MQSIYFGKHDRYLLARLKSNRSNLETGSRSVGSISFYRTTVDRFMFDRHITLDLSIILTQPRYEIGDSEALPWQVELLHSIALI